jgi:hypothetical protein
MPVGERAELPVRREVTAQPPLLLGAAAAAAGDAVTLANSARSCAKCRGSRSTNPCHAGPLVCRSSRSSRAPLGCRTHGCRSLAGNGLEAPPAAIVGSVVLRQGRRIERVPERKHRMRSNTADHGGGAPLGAVAGVTVAAVVVGVASGAGNVSRGCDDRVGREPGRNEGQRGQTAEDGDDDSVYENPPLAANGFARRQREFNPRGKGVDLPSPALSPETKSGRAELGNRGYRSAALDGLAGRRDGYGHSAEGVHRPVLQAIATAPTGRSHREHGCGAAWTVVVRLRAALCVAHFVCAARAAAVRTGDPDTPGGDCLASDVQPSLGQHFLNSHRLPARGRSTGTLRPLTARSRRQFPLSP